MVKTEQKQIIGYEKGAKMVKNYFDQNNEVCEYFISKETIESILEQPGVKGVSIFFGLNEMGENQPIVVGVDSQGNHVLTISTVTANGQLKKEKGIVATGVVSPGTEPLHNDGCGWY